MGCDIHFVLEYQYNNKWVGVYSTGTELPKRHMYQDENIDSYRTTNHYPMLKARNYEFFGKLANVRTDGPDPLGVPDDASDLTIMAIEGWGQDGHSHSYCDLDHFCRAWLEANQEFAAKTMRDKIKKPNLNPTDIHFPYMDADEQCRVVYWFDN